MLQLLYDYIARHHHRGRSNFMRIEANCHLYVITTTTTGAIKLNHY